MSHQHTGNLPLIPQWGIKHYRHTVRRLRIKNQIHPRTSADPILKVEAAGNIHRFLSGTADHPVSPREFNHVKTGFLRETDECFRIRLRGRHRLPVKICNHADAFLRPRQKFRHALCSLRRDLLHVRCILPYDPPTVLPDKQKKCHNRNCEQKPRR